jgi:hypothetical protein
MTSAWGTPQEIIAAEITAAKQRTGEHILAMKTALDEIDRQSKLAREMVDRGPDIFGVGSAGIAAAAENLRDAQRGFTHHKRELLRLQDLARKIEAAK